MTATTAYDRALESSKPTPQWEVDLAVALGYELESFDGIYKLTPDPFIVGADYVLAEEVVTGDDGRTALFDENGDRVTRLVRHPIPEGWVVVPAFRIVPPATAVPE